MRKLTMKYFNSYFCIYSHSLIRNIMDGHFMPSLLMLVNLCLGGEHFFCISGYTHVFIQNLSVCCCFLKLNFSNANTKIVFFFAC